MTNNKSVFLFITLTFIAVLIPCFTHDTFHSYDSMAHFQRMKDINNQIQHFNIPPLFDYYSNNWYGYSWNMFYPPLSAYLMGAVKLVIPFSISDVSQFKIGIAAMILIAFASMYFSCNSIFKCKHYSCISALLFVTSGYFLNDAYIRIDIGELLAMSFSPMIIAGARAIIKDESGKAFFPAGVLAVLLSNIPSFIVCLIYCAIYFSINMKKTIEKSNLLYICKCMLFVSLSSLFFTAPLIYHFFKGDVFAFHALAVSYNTIGKFGVSFRELLFSELLTSGMTTKGLVISSGVVVNALLACYLCKRFNKDSSDIKSIAIIAIFFMAASTSMFPWYMISEKTPVLRFIQFPWRLMLIAVPAAIIVSVCFLKSFNSSILNSCILILSIIFSFSPMQASIQDRVKEIPHHEFHDYMNTEFEASKDKSIDKIQEIKKRPHIQIASKYWSSIKFKINNDEKGIIELPLMYYAGYKARYKDNDIVVSPSPEGIATIPGPINGEVEISYRKEITVIPFAISATFILLSIFIYCRKRNKKPR